jgi:hypothetical protein
MIKAHIGEILEEHIERIAAVAAGLESGAMDLATAKYSLRDL